VASFQRGWRPSTGTVEPYLTYVDFTGTQWSEELEELHEESSRDHFLDVLTRRLLLDAIRAAVPSVGGVVADLGCSTGYLLEDLQLAHPQAQLVGVDVVGAGLRKAHQGVPEAALLLADVCDLPFGSESVQAVVSANMLEHVARDVTALGEIYRVLAPGGGAALVVPYGRRLYDYYDRFLGHERRYGTGELADKASQVGFEVVGVDHLGQLLSPAFYAVKKRNRMLRGRLRDEALRAQVQRDIAATSNSALGAALCALERRLVGLGMALPFGIRELLVLRKPVAGTPPAQATSP
jgi:SAM-dependent methyltransferase